MTRKWIVFSGLGALAFVTLIIAMLSPGTGLLALGGTSLLYLFTRDSLREDR